MITILSLKLYEQAEILHKSSMKHTVCEHKGSILVSKLMLQHFEFAVISWNIPFGHFLLI